MKSLNKDINKAKNVLIVTAHPDDESHSFGGLIQIAKKHNCTVSLLCLTSGKENDSTRIKELNDAANKLGIDLVLSESFVEGSLKKEIHKVRAIIAETIKEVKPDAVFSFDYSGITGHIDHFVLAEELVRLFGKTKPKFTLYLKVPDPRDRKFFTTNKLMTHSLSATHLLTFGFSEALSKLKAIYSYRSKMTSLIYRLHLLEWHIFDHYEFFHEVKVK